MVEIVFAVQVKGWRVWQRNRNRQQRRAPLRGGMAEAVTVVAIAAADTVAEATAVAVMAGRGVKAAGRAGLVVQVDRAVGSANIFARRKSANFAWRR